jgi:3-hydroxybutyryl-CoA dehydratase
MSYTITELFTGQTARLQRTFTQSDVQLCNELTMDFNPVYSSNEDSWKDCYTRPIVPGLLAEGLITQVVSDKLPGCACILLQKELVYYHPVHVGDVITAELSIIDINFDRNWITQKVTCFNQAGSEVIKGQIVLYMIPDR